MAQAAKAIGNVELEALFVRSSEMLERPGTVVFNPRSVRCGRSFRSAISKSRRADRTHQFVSLSWDWWLWRRRGGGRGRRRNEKGFVFSSESLRVLVIRLFLICEVWLSTSSS
jgi:hypothetical protein